MVDMIDREWRRTVGMIRACGNETSPRGMRVKELDHNTVAVNTLYSVLRCPARHLNYRFMAAEALWILEGSDRLADLTKYNPNMAAFSDDGLTLAGAYGPRVMPQMPYVISKLREDRDTRQATLTIWEPRPAPSKDIPCTVAMDFKIRRDRLDLHVFMRSSDAWLGLPYDVFSFSCVAFMACATYNSAAAVPATPGTLYLTMASSHLYEANWGADIGEPPDGWGLPVPEPYHAQRPSNLLASLRVLRDSRKGDVARWWER